MLHATALAPEMLWYQTTLLRRIIGGDFNDNDSGKRKTPSLLQQFKPKKKLEPTATHAELVLEFNSNVPMAGLSPKLKEEAAGATMTLLSEVICLFNYIYILIGGL
jgi:hypothetical protein